MRRWHTSRNSTAGVLMLMLLFAMGGSGQGAQRTLTPQLSEFDVASLKLDTTCSYGGFEGPSPSRLNFRCVHMRDLIQVAYGAFSNSKLSPRQLEVLGGPAWLDSQLYDLSAKANAPLYEMAGPMLQSLLHDRCKLRVHNETRMMPVYALTVAKGGVKMEHSKEGRCTPLDFSHLAPQPTPGQPQPVYCGLLLMGGGLAIHTLSARGMTMAEFSGRMLAGRLDRPVIDKTGLTGKFDIDLTLEMRRADRESDLARDTGTSLPPGVDESDSFGAPSTPAALSILTAIQEQLGLRLSPEKGSVEVLVVDYAEKPYQ